MCASARMPQSRIGDGSWVCIDPITIDHPNGQMQFTAGTTLMPGTIFMGVELTAWLDEKAGVAG